MAQALLKYETIDNSQIDSIMQGKEPGPPQDWSDTHQPPGVSDEDPDSDSEKDKESSKTSIGGHAGQH